MIDPVVMGTAKGRAMARIAAACLASGRALGYVREEAGTVHAYCCKDCGEPIRGLVEDERYSESREINGQMVVFKRMVMASLPNYREITIQFDDGSAHVTSLCAECISHLTLAALEWIYAADLQRFADLEARGLGTARWDLYADRKPVGFRLGG